MSDDIVDRLRSNRWTGQRQQRKLRREAADEIERLRAALRGERFAHTRLWDWWSDALVERNRLRDGIAEIVGGEWSDMPGPTHPRRRLWALIEGDDQ